MARSFCFLLLIVSGVMSCKSKGSTKTINKNAKGEGILITGGHFTETSTDLFIFEDKMTCTLPHLPQARFNHAMGVVAGTPIICGGRKMRYTDDKETARSCLHFTPNSTTGVWAEYVNMSCPRAHTYSWVSTEGMIVFGAMSEFGNRGNCSDAEILPSGRGYDFEGKYKVYSCNIDDELSTIFTGGIYSADVVERYSAMGKEESLPQLNTGRWFHGCGSFKGSDGRMVLIVAGGESKTYKELSSTEKMIVGQKAWTMVKPLPSILERMASISMMNKVFFIGGITDGLRSDKIIEFDGEDWKETGQLPVARYAHAVAKVDVANFVGFCK